MTIVNKKEIFNYLVVLRGSLKEIIPSKCHGCGRTIADIAFAYRSKFRRSHDPIILDQTEVLHMTS
jgi:hypothetical protein